MISSTSSNLRKITNDFEVDSSNEIMLRSPIELAQQSIFLTCVVNPNPSSPIVWVDHSLEYGTSSDPFSRIFSIDERIIQSMMTEEEPWEDYHHCSHLPDHIEDFSNELNHPSVVDFLSNSVFIDTLDSKRNLSNIKETISINI